MEGRECASVSTPGRILTYFGNTIISLGFRYMSKWSWRLRVRWRVHYYFYPHRPPVLVEANLESIDADQE
jgi:hypothetical protein